jgi:6-methylsalicylate decarboxylase
MATLPFLVDRITRLSLRLPGADSRDPGGAAVYLRRLYYDLAGSTSPAGLGSLLQLVDASHILYGTDWPWSPEPGARELTDALDRSPLLQPDDRARICRQTALDLFPRLRQVAAP